MQDAYYSEASSGDTGLITITVQSKDTSPCYKFSN